MMETRILVISHNYIRFPGDHAGLFIHTLNKSLGEAGFDITVVAPHHPGSTKVDQIDDTHIRRFRYGPDAMETIAYRGTMHETVRNSVMGMFIFSSFMIAFAARLVVEIIRVRPHLLHAHWWFPGGFLAYLFSLVTGIPYVITIHGTDAQLAGGNMILSILCRRVLSRARAVMASSDYLMATLEEQFTPENFRRLRLFKIPVPVEPFDEKSGTVREDSDGNTILTVGRMTDQKNTGVLIEALVTLRNQEVPYTAVIIGDGPRRGDIERMISEGEIEDRVKLILSCEREELAEHFRACSVFVLPSIREGLGLVLVEALFMKKPVAASRSGGVTEIIEDGVTGLLFDPENPNDLAGVLTKLLRDRDLANELAARGYERVRSHFAPLNVARQQADIYRNVLGSKTNTAHREHVCSGKGDS